MPRARARARARALRIHRLVVAVSPERHLAECLRLACPAADVPRRVTHRPCGPGILPFTFSLSQGVEMGEGSRWRSVGSTPQRLGRAPLRGAGIVRHRSR